MKRLIVILALSFVFYGTMGFLPTPSGAEIIMASQDAMISDGDNNPAYQRTDRNFGDWESLTVNWSDQVENKGLIFFDLSVLAAASIHRAEIGLYHSSNNGLKSSFSLYRITSQWNETSVTWNTSPIFDTIPVSTLIINDSSEEKWRYWDITTLAKNWIDGTYENYGVMLARNDQNNPYVYFSTKENFGFEPKIFINESINLVPEPSTALLLGIGLAGTAYAGRRMRRV